MSFFREVDLGPSFPPFATFRDYFGFVPQIFRAQTLLPLALEVEVALGAAVLYRRHQLSQLRKERMMLVLAAAHGSVYCLTARHQLLSLLGVPEDELEQLVRDYQQSSLPPEDVALLDYAVNLALGNPGTPPPGWNDETILEAIQIVAWSKFRATLAAGLGVSPDFVPIHTTPFHVRALTQAGPPGSLAAPALPPDFPSFQSLTGQIGFVPQIFRAQTLRPDSLQAQVQALLAIVFADGNLSRTRKETLLRAAATSDAEKPLLNFATRLSAEPLAVAAGDIDALRGQSFTDEQLLEAIVVIALAGFFGVLQSGLGAGADFLPPSKRMHLLREEPRPTRVSPELDPDAAVVARVQSGEVDAFEDLVNRHTRRVYRTLLGILGNSEEACDAVQETFLKAFRYLGNFQGRSKFSTWLVSIAHNTGIELLRARKPLESLDGDDADPDGSFRPRQIRAWTDDPEQLYSKAETQALVEASVMKLPAKYRVVLMLRDMERLSMEETASALGLGMPALKSRLLRGRLMVREALTPHFSKTARGEPA